MPFNTSLKAKISLIFTLLGMTILWIIAALTYHYSRAELKKSITAQQTALVNTIAQQLDDRLALIHEQLQHFAVLNTKLLDDPRELQRQLNKEDDLRVYFNAGMLAIDRSGKILAEYPFHPERIGTTIPKDCEYFQKTLAGKKPYISSPYRDTLSQEPVIAFTVPILGSDGALRAILVGRQKLWTSKFLGGLADARIGRTGYFVIIDKNRNLVVYPDKDRIYERIKPGGNKGLELALKGFEGTLENANSRGVKGLSSYKHLKAAPWILATFYPADEAYQPLNTAVFYFLLILLGAGIISTLIIRFTMQRMTLPLLKLTEHVVTIDAKQGKDRLVRIESRDEIGKLAQVFNAMIQKIDEHQDNIDEEKSFIESLVTNSAAPIFVLDREHRIIYWNKALEKLSGHKTDDMKGTIRQWEVFYREQRPTLADVVLDHAQGLLPNLYNNYRPSPLVEGAFQAEGWYHLGSAGRHYLRFNAAPIRNAAGEIVGAVETFEDTTDTKRIEERLNDQFRFLQEIIDAIPNPVYYKDRLGRYIGSNRAFEEFIGRPKKDIFGKTICDLIPGEYAKEHFRMSRECINSALPQNYESFLERTDDTLRRVIVTKAPFFDKMGKPAGLVGTFTDITERHALEEEVRKLSLAVEQSPVSIVITGTAGDIEYVNPRFCQVTGYTREEAVGQNPRILKSNETSPECYTDLWRTISSGNEWRGEFQNKRKNGELYWEFAAITPLFDQEGRITGYLASKEDITERKAVEMALNESEARLNKLVNSAQDAIIMLNPDGAISMWNESAVRIFGYSLQEAMGRNFHRLIAPERYRGPHFQAFSTFMATGEGAAVGQVLELSGLRKNGDEFPVELAMSSVQINGQWHAIGILRDITARKQAEQSLAESKAELEVKHAELEELFKWVEAAKVEWEQTLDSLRDLVILTDPAGKVRRCNRLLNQLADKSHDEIIGIDWPDILTEAGFTFSVLNDTSGEVVHKSSNRFYNLYIYDITSPDTGMVTGRVMSLVDTTELRSITEELQKAYDELQTTQIKAFQQEKLASIGQLAAGVAHEINNPMGFISSNLTTLGKYFERTKEFVACLSTAFSDCSSDSGRAGADEQRKRLKIDYIFDDSPQLIAESLDGAQRVRKIVQDLKSFSRVDDAEQKRADLKECLESTIGIAWNEIKYVATLTKDYGDIPPVLCYPQQLNQVFMNLLVNAAHAITGRGEIRVRTWQDDDTVCVSVSDSGCGISEENQKRIFEPFFTTKEVGKGTGLGLSISYDIIKKHHGDILVDSEIGTGTTFTVRIPINGVQD
ncbi:MAG: PAS domain S-box protein [Oryzomonas sp.]|uniref:PAS domain S-box protein n=1 Tax=Oryzomonas sp. TaxID=2855186 RepID=UPI0028505DB7|nr:PAS domain S-box protein [Oryzomonas sp.]MDR3579562.1 PAS domain S-box protein [Oryzomonas sp.]